MNSMETISRDIFSQIRTTIVLNLRFLDMAVFRLKPTPERVTLATDGERLYYQPAWLLNRYRSEPNAVTRDYLHVLLHCIFRHPFVNTLVDQKMWDLACDVAVEGMIQELHLSHTTTRSDRARDLVVDHLRANVKPLTAEKLYAYFRQHAPKADWWQLFHADEHDIWYSPQRAREMAASANKSQKADQNPNTQPDQSGDSPQSDGSGQNQAGQGQSNSQHSQHQSDTQNSQDQSDTQEGQSQPNAQDGHGNLPGNETQSQTRDTGQSSQDHGVASVASSRSQLEQEWRDISEHVQMDLETFAKQQGIQAGGMEQLLSELNREKYDYEAFLKKFAVMGEAMKINDDEFDYIYYTYGMKLFGNMPLIEPLEYKEVKRIREFVIAIDTSGSTSGELVQAFLTNTYNILMSTESFFSKVNIHIVQCDAQIQEAVKITTREEFERYIRHMTIRGLGGTDFRPVFGYVDQLIKQREFRHLKGMIYFTDGCGTFPERKPDYKTAFVYIQDVYNNVSVPPCAIKLILEKDEI